jgi:hypothetical protein
MSLCSPALLYLIIALIAIVSMIYSKTDMQTVAMKGLFVIIYTMFLNFLCSKGHEGISWFLVILPFVVMALFIVAMSNIIGGKITAQQKEMFRGCNVDDLDEFCSRIKNRNSPCCTKYCNVINCNDGNNSKNQCCIGS